MWRVVVFTCALALVSSQTTEVSRCLWQEGQLPLKTYVEGCTTPPCQFPQLQDAVFNIFFRARHTMTSLRTLLTVYLPVGSIALPIPYDLGEDAVTCNNISCPVLQNEFIHYSLKVFIESVFPVGTSLTLELRVVDTSNGRQDPLLCIRVPFSFVDPVNRIAGSAA